MKNKQRYWLAGVLLFAAGVGLFAILKTKSVNVSWNLDNAEFGTTLCENCGC